MAIFTTALMCLALNVYKEARGEPVEGKLAVAMVTLNRSKKQDKPVCEVVFARKQFSWTITDVRHGKVKKTAMPDFRSRVWNDCLAIARVSMLVRDRTGGATFFHEKSIRPYWTKSLAYVGQWGNHKFYKVPA